MMMDLVTRQAWVSGLVQGVSFRVSTQRQAQRLGITGYANNLADGRVEVLMTGDSVAVQELTDWLAEGPRYARVDDLSYRDCDFQPFDSFTVG